MRNLLTHVRHIDEVLTHDFFRGESRISSIAFQFLLPKYWFKESLISLALTMKRMIAVSLTKYGSNLRRPKVHTTATLNNMKLAAPEGLPVLSDS
jgi:hypothetical protein